MKKYMLGFVPVNFQQVGKILLLIGIVSILIKVLSYFTKWFEAPGSILYTGAMCIIISLYLMYVVPKA